MKHERETQSRNGRSNECDVVLNPPDDYVLDVADELIVVAEDDNTYHPRLVTTIPTSTLSSPDVPVVREPERASCFLFKGFRLLLASVATPTRAMGLACRSSSSTGAETWRT